MLLSIFLSAALAAAPPEAEPDWSALVDAAADLGAQGLADQAHATLDLALAQPLPPDLRTRAEAVRAGLPLSRHQVGAMAQLALGQALVGSYLAGPHVARLTYDPQRSATPYYLGALGGAAVGAGSALWLGTRPGFDQAQAHSLLTAEVLGGATGVAIGYLADPYDQTGPAWGLLAGVGVGAGLGALAASLDPSPTQAFAAQSGALWGGSLAGAGVVFVEGGETEQGVVVPVVLGADVGAALGLMLADRLDLTTRQLAFADLGLALGSGAGGLIVAIMATDGDVEPKVGALIVSGLGVATGVTTAALAGPTRPSRRAPLASAALSGQPGDLHLALPVPALLSPLPDRQASLHLRLVDLRY